MKRCISNCENTAHGRKITICVTFYRTFESVICALWRFTAKVLQNSWHRARGRRQRPFASYFYQNGKYEIGNVCEKLGTRSVGAHEAPVRADFHNPYSDASKLCEFMSITTYARNLSGSLSVLKITGNCSTCSLWVPIAFFFPHYELENKYWKRTSW